MIETEPNIDKYQMNYTTEKLNLSQVWNEPLLGGSILNIEEIEKLSPLPDLSSDLMK